MNGALHGIHHLAFRFTILICGRRLATPVATITSEQAFVLLSTVSESLS